jgi:exodeoxyribonuclease-3
VGIGDDYFATTGRWVEADYIVRNAEGEASQLTVVSAYVHSGEAGTPKQEDKYRLLAGMTERMAELGAGDRRSVVLGDLNVGHTELDIKNWKGNVKRAGFLPEERAYFDRFFGHEDDPDYNAGAGFGWVDVGRRWAGEVDGPYTWWSQRGKAFDTDTGWRIDYHMATAPLAATVTNYAIDRASAWDTRWSDHAPVVVDYAI